MTAKTDIEQVREGFEAAVIKRMKESGFLEVEVRTECLVRSGDDYQDELINYGWWAWQAGRAVLQSQDREDATRIDWMARQDLDDLCFSIIRDAPHDGEYCVDAGRGPVFGGTFREAIDHARRIEGEGK